MILSTLEPAPIIVCAIAFHALRSIIQLGVLSPLSKAHIDGRPHAATVAVGIDGFLGGLAASARTGKCNTVHCVCRHVLAPGARRFPRLVHLRFCRSDCMATI